VWHTHEVVPLFEYIQDAGGSDHPLILAGFDMKPSSTLAQPTRPAFMRSVVEGIDPVFGQEVNPPAYIY
jgi:erythromycin esterase-like protein